MNREMFEEAAGEQFDDPTMAELQDAILYSLFPNLQVWIGYGGNIVYRFLPNGNDPDSCIFDVDDSASLPERQRAPAGRTVRQ